MYGRLFQQCMWDMGTDKSVCLGVSTWEESARSFKTVNFEAIGSERQHTSHISTVEICMHHL